MTFSREASNQSPADINQFQMVEEVWDQAAGNVQERLDAFPKFVTRQAMGKFLARYEIFKRVLSVNGSIVECGVLYGGGLFTWAKLSSLLEPAHHTRKIIGFDTFSGFPSTHDEDAKGTSSHLEPGGLTGRGAATGCRPVRAHQGGTECVPAENVEGGTRRRLRRAQRRSLPGQDQGGRRGTGSAVDQGRAVFIRLVRIVLPLGELRRGEILGPLPLPPM